MSKIKWIIFAAVVIAIFVGIILVSKNNSKPFTGDATKIITQGPIADHVVGPKDQKVVLIEYGDYECPGCGAMYQTVKNITTQYQDKLTFIFRNMPLTTIHPNALAAATAVEAAGLQGKYFEMHDKLYETQDSWANASVSQRSSIFAGYASDIGLNVDKFNKDLTSADISAKIDRDRSTAATFKVDSTPSFVLNGKLLDSSIGTNPDAFTKAVTDAVNAAYPPAK
jgi:protein-disulfide isomerase